MQHLYGVQSSANTKTSATNIPAANTSSAELSSIIATDEICDFSFMFRFKPVFK
jgi:hypothetical protein